MWISITTWELCELGDYIACYPLPHCWFIFTYHSLGAGGFGTVVKAIQRATNDTCAVKIITRSGLSDKFLHREINIMKLIQHVRRFNISSKYYIDFIKLSQPHIIQLIETIESGKRICKLLLTAAAEYTNISFCKMRYCNGVHWGREPLPVSGAKWGDV